MSSEPKGHLFTKQEIADAEEISCAYVQQLMILLSAAGLVTGRRGKVGGFVLAQTADSITVADVLKATEGEITLAPCLGMEHCHREALCPVRSLWQQAGEMLGDLFTGVTIAELAQRATGLGLTPGEELTALSRWDADEPAFGAYGRMQ